MLHAGTCCAATAQPTLLTARERSTLSQISAVQRSGSAGLTPAGNAVRTSPSTDRPLSAAEQNLEASLRAWRSEQAAIAGLPSFFVLSDTALKQVALTQPKSLAELKGLPGFGPDKVERYGPDLLKFCQEAGNMSV